MSEKNKNTPDRAGSRVEELSTERMVQIAKRLYRILQEEGCTVAEAGKVLDFTQEAVLTVTRVRCDFPLDV